MAALDVNPHDAIVAKAAIATVAAVTSQMLTYVLLAWGEPGSFFPCCVDDNEQAEEDAVMDSATQPIDLLVAAVRELRNGLVAPSPEPVVSLRCCDDRRSVCVGYRDGSCSTVRPKVLSGAQTRSTVNIPEAPASRGADTSYSVSAWQRVSAPHARSARFSLHGTNPPPAGCERT